MLPPIQTTDQVLGQRGQQKQKQQPNQDAGPVDILHRRALRALGLSGVRLHPRNRVAAQVEVEQSIIRNVEGMAELGLARQQETRVANGPGYIDPQQALVDLGTDDSGINSSEAKRHPSLIQPGWSRSGV